MRSLLKGNGELDLTGVDYADLPKSGAKKIRLIGNTDIADLPFETASVDGLASQFGIEYTDIDASAPEIARVSNAGAKLQFIIHHAQGPIVAQNQKRHAALKGVARSSIISNAKMAVTQPCATRPWSTKAFSLIARSHPDQPVVRKIAAGVDNAIRLGGKKGSAELGRIERNLTQECEVLDALLGLRWMLRVSAPSSKRWHRDLSVSQPDRQPDRSSPRVWRRRSLGSFRAGDRADF